MSVWGARCRDTSVAYWTAETCSTSRQCLELLFSGVWLMILHFSMLKCLGPQKVRFWNLSYWHSTRCPEVHHCLHPSVSPTVSSHSGCLPLALSSCMISQSLFYVIKTLSSLFHAFQCSWLVLLQWGKGSIFIPDCVLESSGEVQNRFWRLLPDSQSGSFPKWRPGICTLWWLPEILMEPAPLGTFPPITLESCWLWGLDIQALKLALVVLLSV